MEVSFSLIKVFWMPWSLLGPVLQFAKCVNMRPMRRDVVWTAEVPELGRSP